MTRGEMLARAVIDSGELLRRYLAGFDDSNCTTQAPGLPNHAAWCLGHCALTMHRAAECLDGGARPAAHFIDGADRGDVNRFGTESVSFDSRPTDDPKRYPGLARSTAIFDAACRRLAHAARTIDDSRLDGITRWGRAETPISGLVSRMVFHNGTHCGQIVDLRRALRLGSIFA